VSADRCNHLLVNIGSRPRREPRYCRNSAATGSAWCWQHAPRYERTEHNDARSARELDIRDWADEGGL
jgi:hypothetical protein